PDGVLADSAGEDDRVGPVQLDEVGPEELADRRDEDLQGQGRLRVSGVGLELDVAEVAPRAAQAFEAGGIRERVQDLVERLPRLAEEGGEREDVEVADAVVVREPRLGAHPQAARLRLAVLDRAERRGAAEVAGDDLQIITAEQFGHPAGDIAMARAVEAP